MGKLASIKTKPTASSVADFIAGIADEQKRKDSQAIIAMMEKATKERPKMWGSSMIGLSVCNRQGWPVKITNIAEYCNDVTINQTTDSSLSYSYASASRVGIFRAL